MSWSDQRVLRFSGPRSAFDSPLPLRRASPTALRDEIRQRARAYALENGGDAHRSRVAAAMQRKKARAEQKKWLARVERAQRLQDRENSARSYLMRRGMQRGSDFSAGERQELRKWFDILDADAGGDIDIAELAAPLLSTGIAQSLPEVRKIIEANAIEVGGGIDFESFQRMLKVKPHRHSEASDEGPRDKNGVGEHLVEAAGKTAMKRLRAHVEASQSNVGLQLDSLINANRRSILLKAVADIKSDARIGSNARQNTTLAARREAAALAQRREDRLLGLYRVVIGSKDSNVAGFYQGKLPSLNKLNREAVYGDWAKRLPMMHADSNVVTKPWERVNYWLNRSCFPGAAYLEAEAEEGHEEVLEEGEQSHSGSALSGPTVSPMHNTHNRRRSESDPKLQLERSLSKYLRPTRADAARVRSYRKRKKKKEEEKGDGLRELRNVQSEPVLPAIGRVGSLAKPRRYPPFSIVVDESSTKPSYRPIY